MSHKHAASPPQEAEIRRMHSEGYAASVIARQLGIKLPTMYATYQRLGLQSHRHGLRRNVLTPAERLALVEAYAEGESTTALAAKHDLTNGTIARYLREAGVELRPAGFRHGAAHHKWAGGRVVTPQGYVLLRVLPDDPYFCMSGEKVKGTSYALEHRLVLARHLGRPLTENETVHHIDGNKQNNALENLQLRWGSHGKGSSLQCRCCGSTDIISVPIADPLG